MALSLPARLHCTAIALAVAGTALSAEVHDLHATILHLMGIDHERLIYKYQGRDFRLTDVHGRVVRDII